MKLKLTFLAVVFICIFTAVAFGRDLGQWASTDYEVKYWFQHLMQPDNPTMSCCGEADAYYADGFETQGDQYVAIITDERPDGPLLRAHVDVGTKILIPNTKIKFDQSNPTGHGLVFMNKSGGYVPTTVVYCYLPPLTG